MPLGLLWDNVGVTLALTLGLFGVKTAVMYVLAKVFHLRGPDPWLFALGLAQAGEFGFVLLAFTVADGILPAAIADELLRVVALSMLLTPALFISYAQIIAPRHLAPDREAGAIPEANQIIIAGHGRVGGVVNRMLRSAGMKTTVIDYNSRQIEMLDKFGIRACFGDATRHDLLLSAGIAQARLLVIAIDDKAQITALVRHVAPTYPDVHILARAVDRNHVYDLWAVGCRDIVCETYDSSLRMGRSAFEALGASREQADKITTVFNDNDREAMIEAAEHYDPGIPFAEPGIPFAENEKFIASVCAMTARRQEELGSQIVAILNRVT